MSMHGHIVRGEPQPEQQFGDPSCKTEQWQQSYSTTFEGYLWVFCLEQKSPEGSYNGWRSQRTRKKVLDMEEDYFLY